MHENSATSGMVCCDSNSSLSANDPFDIPPSIQQGYDSASPTDYFHSTCYLDK